MDAAAIRDLLARMGDAAAIETLPRFRSALRVADKGGAAGFDPVTEADREAERAIRAILGAERGGDGIVGEEFGNENQDAPWQWIVDPVDGTRAFVSGLPVWGTLVGLYRDGVPVAGLVDQPFTGERYVGVVGEGATLALRGAAPVAVRAAAVTDLSRATLMTTDPGLFAGAEAEAFQRLSRACRLRRYGCDCYAYAMLAAGHVDLVVESGLHIYDIAAPLALVRAAGGVVTDWSGGDASRGGQALAAANPRLHEAALRMLRG